MASAAHFCFEVSSPPMSDLGLLVFFFVLVAVPLFLFVKLRRTELRLQTRSDLDELKRLLSDTLTTTKTHLKARNGDDGSGGNARPKKKKRRANKKCASHLKSEEDDCGGGGGEEEESGCRVKKADVVCFYPFTSSTSATQRKIKKQYDELMKCNVSNKLTLPQVGQFATCLIEARNELQNKADAIQRKFTIRKALLYKADRSSFDRLRKEICKLELEQKGLEEDASVYNWLQQQLKLSPAYKKMLEISASLESRTKSREQIESKDVEFTGISFEDFLAQEKKDSFWQKNMKSKTCSS